MDKEKRLVLPVDYHLKRLVFHYSSPRGYKPLYCMRRITNIKNACEHNRQASVCLLSMIVAANIRPFSKMPKDFSFYCAFLAQPVQDSLVNLLNVTPEFLVVLVDEKYVRYVARYDARRHL